MNGARLVTGLIRVGVALLVIDLLRATEAACDAIENHPRRTLPEGPAGLYVLVTRKVSPENRKNAVNGHG